MEPKHDPEFDVILPAASEEPRKSGRSKRQVQAPPKRRYAFKTVMAVLAAAAGMWGFQQVERLLIRDSRFALEAPEPGEDSPSIRTRGLTRASRNAVLGIFQRDYGRSVYLLPLAERRRNLLAVSWVREASVSRIWPNRIDVEVIEREPVAFVQLPSGDGAAPFRFALIDADGVILEPQAAVRYQLPVLSGLTERQPENVRRDRVKRAMKLVREIGPLTKGVSEIDVEDPDNLKVTYEVSRRIAVLMLGNQRFRPRLENFLNHYDDIRRRMPDARKFDLRLEDRITAVQGGPGE